MRICSIPYRITRRIRNAFASGTRERCCSIRKTIAGKEGSNREFHDEQFHEEQNCNKESTAQGNGDLNNVKGKTAVKKAPPG